MLPELQQCEEAEDFFEALHVQFDPKALDARRVMVMRRFGELLVSVVDRYPGAEDEVLRHMARAALQEAYAAPLQAERKGGAGGCGACALMDACGTPGPADEQ